jgi:hypothetical protein
MCAAIEGVKVRGIMPRIGLGVECRLGIGALKGECSVGEGVGSNGQGGKLVEYLVIATK